MSLLWKTPNIHTERKNGIMNVHVAVMHLQQIAVSFWLPTTLTPKVRLEWVEFFVEPDGHARDLLFSPVCLKSQVGNDEGNLFFF